MADSNTDPADRSESSKQSESSPGSPRTEQTPNGEDPSTSFWRNPPEWMEELQDEGAEVIPMGTQSQSKQIAYISLRTTDSIGISQRAMQQYFYNVDALAIAVKSVSSSKKLYLKPIENPDEVPITGSIKKKDSGSGVVQVGSIFEKYNLDTDQPERYPISWDDELDVGVVNLNKKPLNG